MAAAYAQKGGSVELWSCGAVELVELETANTFGCPNWPLWPGSIMVRWCADDGCSGAVVQTSTASIA